jgi:hypothetical protein
MHSLPKSFLPILIASALLLSASVGRGDEKHQNQSSAHRHETDSQSRKATPALTIVVEPAPVQIIQSHSSDEKENAEQKWYQRPTITDWGILVVTLVYTGISIGLFVIAKRSADAAMVAAQAAARALGADRSFLEIEKPDLKGTNLFVAHFHFKNRGKRPAVIDKLSFSFEPTEQQQPDQPPPDYKALIARATPQKQIAELVIGAAGESSTYYAHCFDVKPIQIAGGYDRRGPLFNLLNEQKLLTLSGIVEFHDTSGDSHVSEFIWSYAPFGSGYWYCDYNHQT